MHDIDQKYGNDILPTSDSEPRDAGAGCVLNVFIFCHKIQETGSSLVEVFADFCDKLQERGNFWRGAP